MKIAIFDFDGTLYTKETFPVLMKHLKHHPLYKKRYGTFFRAALLPYIGYKCKLYKEDKMKYKMMQYYLHAFKGLSSHEIEQFFKEVAEEMLPDINEKVKGKLKEHARDGMEIFIISGAFTPLVEQFTKDLPISQIIATNIPIKNGVYNAREEIVHVQGKRKEQFIRQALKGSQVQWESSVSYADSFSDLPILEIVGHPVCVDPDEGLQAIAKEKGWKVLP